MVTEFAEIGLRIKGLREACDVTDEDMARELEVPVGTYEEWEATGADVPISAIYHMAHHFGVEFTEILTGTAAKLQTYQVVKNVGNYGEIFDRTLGSKSDLKLTRGLNGSWTKGGLMYSMPFR